MSEFTREAPFKFDGVGVWRDEGEERWPIQVRSKDDFDSLSQAHADAVHAFIEAEREGWHWLNDEHTEARNGRWCVRRPDYEGVHYLFHDDLTDGDHITAIFTDNKSPERQAADRGISPGCVKAFTDFLAWRDAQNQPEETTEPQPTPESSPKKVATIELRLDAAGLADDLESVVAAIRGALDGGSDSQGSAS